MNTKLTLNLEKVVIYEAKYYARINKMSLSKLIENYLLAITKATSKADGISPLVESLTDVISDEKTDFKSDYIDYLLKKHA